jgi:hypothetical protein
MDPGRTTGLVILRINPEEYEVVDTAAVGGSSEVVDILRAWNAKHADLPHVLVYENFHVRPDSVIPDASADTVIDAVRLWAEGPADDLQEIYNRLRSTPHSDKEVLDGLAVAIERAKAQRARYALITSQEPVAAKRLVPNAVLDKLGLVAGGPDARHIRDAYRHAVTLLARWRHMPTCERAWPRTS